MYSKIVDRFTECRKLVHTLQEEKDTMAENIADVFFKTYFLRQILEQVEIWDKKILYVLSTPSHMDFQFLSQLIKDGALKFPDLADYDEYRRIADELLETIFEEFTRNEPDVTSLYYSIKWHMISHLVKNISHDLIITTFSKMIDDTIEYFGILGMNPFVNALSQPYSPKVRSIRRSVNNYEPPRPSLIPLSELTLKMLEVIEVRYLSNLQIEDEKPYEGMIITWIKSQLNSNKSKIYEELQNKSKANEFATLAERYRTESLILKKNITTKNKEVYLNYMKNSHSIENIISGEEFLELTRDPWLDEPEKITERSAIEENYCQSIHIYYQERVSNHNILLKLLHEGTISQRTISDIIESEIVISKLLNELNLYAEQGVIEASKEKKELPIIVDKERLEENLKVLSHELGDLLREFSYFSSTSELTDPFPKWGDIVSISSEVNVYRRALGLGILNWSARIELYPKIQSSVLLQLQQEGIIEIESFEDTIYHVKDREVLWNALENNVYAQMTWLQK